MKENWLGDQCLWNPINLWRNASKFTLVIDKLKKCWSTLSVENQVIWMPIAQSTNLMEKIR